MNTPRPLTARLRSHLSALYDFPHDLERARAVAGCFVALELSDYPKLYNDVLTTIRFRADRARPDIANAAFTACAVACLREFLPSLPTPAKRLTSLLGMGVPAELLVVAA